MMYFSISALLAIVFFFIVWKKGENTGFSIISSLIIGLIFWWINWANMPVLSLWGFYGVWFEIAIVTLVAAVLSGKDGDSDKTYKFHWIPFLVVAAVLIASQIASIPAGRSDRYQKMLIVKEAPDSLFNAEMHPIPVERMCLVPYNVAHNRARKVLGDVPGLASRVEVGKLTKQTLTAEFIINDGQKLVFDKALIWVAPLEHIGFMKWNANEITPGYVIVDATNEKNAYLVQKLNGEELKLRYLEKACFGDYIERHIRKNGYASEGITDYCFELDHNGRPYWVLANYEKTIGFSGEEVKGIVTVDVQNGEIKEYSIAESPAWADRVQPEKFISSQISYWGKYKKGFWNALFAEDSVEIATDYMSLVDVEGGSFWYTGIKSSNSEGDDATSGFILTDTKTKEAMLYRISGISEGRAVSVASKLSIAGGSFEASAPILYNISGIPSYFMLLTRGDAVIGYCFVAVKDELCIAYGETVKQAEKAYISKCLERKIGHRIVDGPLKAIEAKTYVVEEITNENDMYYMHLRGEKGKEFVGSSTLFKELRWTKDKHRVSITFGEGEDDLIHIESFENLDYSW